MSSKEQQRKQIQKNKEAQKKNFDVGIRPDRTMSIGVVLDQFGQDGFSDTIANNINTFVKETPGVDFICYYNVQAFSNIFPLFPLIHTSDIYGHFGPVIYFFSKQTPMISKAPLSGRKYFYAAFPEWDMCPPEMDLTEFYTAKNITIIAASQEISQNIRSRYGVQPKYVVPNFYTPDIVKIVGRECYYEEPAFSLALD